MEGWPCSPPFLAGDRLRDPYQSHPKMKLLDDTIVNHFRTCKDKSATRVMVFSSVRRGGGLG